MAIAAFADLSFGQFLIAVLLAAGVSTWVYWHASKRGSRHATAWGVATFLCVALVLPVYLIHFYATRRRL
jgi:hypothetical protein